MVIKKFSSAPINRIFLISFWEGLLVLNCFYNQRNNLLDRKLSKLIYLCNLEGNSLIERIEKFAKDLCEKNEEDPHLFHHVLLVRDYAVKLAVIEGADVEACEIAALLHDIGKYKGSRNHHILGRELAKGFLDTLDLSEEKKNLILKCIVKHRSRFSSDDNELEVKVIQSADCLGSLANEQWQEYCRKTMSKKNIASIL